MDTGEMLLKTEHYCRAFGVTIPDGYEVVDFADHIKCNHFALLYDGSLWKSWVFSGMKHQMPILRKTKRKTTETVWVTPTDDDARMRPRVQVKWYDSTEWDTDTDFTLVHVSYVEDNKFPFMVIDSYGEADWFEDCRMDEKEREK
jgi:hypothetical protein